MRNMKRSTRRLLIACVLIIACVAYMKYMFAIERNYPQIREMYDACREKAEQVYPLVLPYLESSGQDWYYFYSYSTPLEGEAKRLLGELEAINMAIRESTAGGTIDFHKTHAGNWCMEININGGYGHLISLSYYPYDELPHFNDSFQLEGLADGWSFTATGTY